MQSEVSLYVQVCKQKFNYYANSRIQVGSFCINTPEPPQSYLFLKNEVSQKDMSSPVCPFYYVHIFRSVVSIIKFGFKHFLALLYYRTGIFS